VRYTERGPLSHSGNNWISMRWTVLEPSNEMQALYDAAHARNAYDFQASMAKNFWAPAQNMLVADRSGTIAIRSTGHFPIRPAGTTGRFLFDGSTSSSDWVGFWPVNELPQSVNPAQGFLASANQEPEAPAAQFGYIGSDPDFEVWRALRINELLRSDSSVTVDDITRWQTDPSSTRAKLFLPYLINAASSLDSMGRGTAELDSAAHLLRQWDGRYTLDNECSVLFEAAMHELAARTWDELLRDGQRVATPTSAVLVELMTQPSNPWWDDRRTANVVESRDDIIAASLVAAYRDVTTEYGPSDAGGWRWDRIRFANIYHLLRIPAFSALRIPVPGGVGTLTPSSGDGEYGPSWRMVVQMGPSVQAWGTLPGGQSGNPLSPRYRDHLTTWARGTLAPLLFPKAAANLSSAETTASLSLEPAR
jgi:penicillin amidase